MFLIAPQFSDVDLLKPFDSARQQAELTWDQMADLLDIKPQQLYQQLRGAGHLSWSRMFAMCKREDGRRFMRAFLPLVAEAAGLDELADGLRLAAVMRQRIDRYQARIGKLTMAKAELRNTQERKAAM